jgi:hypothetical protein
MPGNDNRWTEEEHLKMFGTKEQLEAYYERKKFWDSWIEENIPVYKPKFPWDDRSSGI